MKTRFNPFAPATPAVQVRGVTKKAKAPKPRTAKRRRTVDLDEALTRALAERSLANYPVIIEGFKLKGIPEDDIKPRENVFTFNAWKAQGRVVKRGEHGVKVCTWVERTRKKRDELGNTTEEPYKFPWSTTVFHISQTEPMRATEKPAASAPLANPAPAPVPRSSPDRWVKKPLRSEVQHPVANAVLPVDFKVEPPAQPIPVPKSPIPARWARRAA